MGKEYTIQEALKLAIQAEKDSMDFYRRAAAAATNERSIKIFNLLAAEEAGHLKSFFEHYKGTEFGELEKFMQSAPSHDLPPMKALLSAIGNNTHEKEALEIALQEEKMVIQQYTALAKDMVDPLVRAVFNRVVVETQGHYDMIEDEYSHVMGMVDKTDQDTFVRE